MKRVETIMYASIVLCICVLMSLPATASAAPAIISPAPSSTLSDSTVIFNWTTGGTSVDEWWLYIGTSAGGLDIHDSGELGSSTSTTVSGLPCDGSTIHVRLWYRQGINWPFVDFQYTACTNAGGGTPEITSPVNGSTLSGSTETFNWTANGMTVTNWWLYIGTVAGGSDIHDSGDLGSSTSTTVSGLPCDGSTIYARLWYRQGINWPFVDFQYTACTNGGGGTPEITSPVTGSTLSGSTETFNWTANGTTVTNWWLYIGTVAEGSDIHDSGDLGSSTSTTVGALPTDGSTVYVTLFYQTGGVWYYGEGGTYTAHSNGGGGTPEITSPVNGSTLSGSTVTFNWTANGTTVTNWWLYIGTVAEGSDIHDSGDLGSSTSTTVGALPTDGSTVYVTLFYQTGGVWYYGEGGIYTAYSNGGGGTPEITSPVPGTTLEFSTVEFQWSAGSGVDEYWLGVGTSLINVDGTSSYGDIYGLSTGRKTSVIISGISINGNTLYVRLWYRIGPDWFFIDYTYQTDPFVTDPFVYITQPQSYHLQVSPDLFVHANVDNLPQNYGIKFVLDSLQESFDYTDPYEVTFAGLSKAEHVVDAYIVDGSGNEVTGSYTYHQIIQIGIGDYYVAVGDSITFGWGDDISTDNISSDGRNGVGGGFEGGAGCEPILNDLLTQQKGYPHTVANEGVNGDTSSDGAMFIGAYLANHPGAQYFLVQYGTNDAYAVPPVPSGEGLNQGDPDYPGTFKDNMQQIITAIIIAGKEVYLAKSPYIADPSQSAKNTSLQAYNRVVDELVSENSISIVPPDFYTYFENNQNEYNDDDLHPNGTGYQSMADLWFLNLNP